LPGAENILKDILTNLISNDFKSVTIALESTSYYSLHLTNFLSTNEDLLPFHPIVYNLNPKNIKNYKKSFTDMDKTDPNDAFVIADFVRIGRVNVKPWQGTHFIALQRLTRHRLHLIGALSKEKTYALTNIYLKFNQLTFY